MVAAEADGPAYPDLPEERQVEVLRAVAGEAALAYGLDVAHLAVVLHGFNTTFRLDEPRFGGGNVQLYVPF